MSYKSMKKGSQAQKGLSAKIIQGRLIWL